MQMHDFKRLTCIAEVPSNSSVFPPSFWDVIMKLCFTYIM